MVDMLHAHTHAVFEASGTNLHDMKERALHTPDGVLKKRRTMELYYAVVGHKRAYQRVRKCVQASLRKLQKKDKQRVRAVDANIQQEYSNLQEALREDLLDHQYVPKDRFADYSESIVHYLVTKCLHGPLARLTEQLQRAVRASPLRLCFAEHVLEHCGQARGILLDLTEHVRLFHSTYRLMDERQTKNEMIRFFCTNTLQYIAWGSWLRLSVRFYEEDKVFRDLYYTVIDAYLLFHSLHRAAPGSKLQALCRVAYTVFGAKGQQFIQSY